MLAATCKNVGMTPSEPNVDIVAFCRIGIHACVTKQLEARREEEGQQLHALLFCGP